MKALVVSSDVECRRLLRQVLEERGHDVADANDSEAAESVCHIAEIALVLIDWHLGASDGLEVCRDLRTCCGMNLGVILVLVNGVGLEEAEVALDAGADDVLTTPVDLGVLRRRLIWAERQATDRRAGREAKEELARERHLFHALLNTLPDPIYFKDANSRFTRMNHACAAVLGYDRPDQALGKTDYEFYPEWLAAQFLVDERRILATGNPLVNQLEPQTESDSGQRWLLTTKSPVYGSDGAIVGIVGNAKDVTERKRAELALAGQRRVLELLAAGAPLREVLETLCLSLDAMLEGRAALSCSSTNTAAGSSTARGRACRPHTARPLTGSRSGRAPAPAAPPPSAANRSSRRTWPPIRAGQIFGRWRSGMDSAPAGQCRSATLRTAACWAPSPSTTRNRAGHGTRRWPR